MMSNPPKSPPVKHAPARPLVANGRTTIDVSRGKFADIDRVEERVTAPTTPTITTIDPSTVRSHPDVSK